MASGSEFERREINEGFGDSVFSKMIKAGHRTYFLDVKTTRANDYFLTITELRKENNLPAGRERTQQGFFVQRGLREVRRLLRRDAGVRAREV